MLMSYWTCVWKYMAGDEHAESETRLLVRRRGCRGMIWNFGARFSSTFRLGKSR